MRFKVGDRVRNTGRCYSNLAKEGTVISLGAQRDTLVPIFLVQFDGYCKLNCTEKDIKLIKEETMEQVKTVYKPLVETPDGELISVWAGDAGCHGTILEYKEGEITYAPEGSAGIWVSKSLGEANNQFCNKNKEGVSVIHEVAPLGKECLHDTHKWGSFGQDTRYPAILLGKRVYQGEPPEEPKEEWVDVTKKCTSEINLYERAYGLGLTVRLKHNGAILGYFGAKGFERSIDCPPSYAFEEVHKWGTGNCWLKVSKQAI